MFVLSLLTFYQSISNIKTIKSKRETKRNLEPQEKVELFVFKVLVLKKWAPSQFQIKNKKTG